MPARRPVMKRLRDIEYTQIDRVGSGAQPDAHVTLVKARKVALSKLADPEATDPESEPAPVPVTKSEQKESPMPTPVKKAATAVAEAPDLTALDDETRAAVEAALTERDALADEKATFEAAVAAAVPAPPAAETAPVEDEDDEVDDLGSVEGLRKAISKSRGENRKLLKAVLARVEQSEETTAKLQKAARTRLFKERAGELHRVAAHAVDAGGDPISGLGGLLDTIDSGCGSETAEAVESLLSKAQTQIEELMDKKDLLKSVGRHEGDAKTGKGAVISGDDPLETVDGLAADIQKANPDLTLAQARTRVLKARPDLYADYEASSKTA